MLGFVLALAQAPVPTPLSPPTPPAEVELTWEAPESCPSGEAVIARYQALLSMAPNGEGLMEAHATVTRQPDGLWRLDLTTRMDEYTDVRKLRADNCGDLVEATAMLFAVALEPSLWEEPDEASAPPEAVATEREAEPEPEEPEALDERDPEVRVQSPSSVPAPEIEPALPSIRRRGYAYLAAGPEIGALPRLTGRVSLGVGYTWTWPRLEGGLVWYAPRSEPGSFGSATIQVLGAELRGCAVQELRRWVFPLCFGVEGGGTIATIERPGGGRTIGGRWFTLSLRAGAGYRWRRLSVLASLEGAGPLVGTEVQVDDDTVVEPTAGSFRGLLRGEFYFF